MSCGLFAMLFYMLFYALYVVGTMKKLKPYITAMRLRTLPQSLAGVALGLLLATADYVVNPWTAFFTLLTAVFLQILSNTSNELGDFLKGTDRKDDRKGPAYTLTQGLISEKGYRTMVWTYVALSAASGLTMVWFSFGTFFSYGAIITLFMGLMAISAAMRYTLGKNPYGYRGYGDLNVFIYFGIVSVLGSYFVAAHEIPNWYLLLPAVSVGCLSTAVLNVNNIRDIESDRLTRRTIPVRFGEKKAKVYHVFLVTAGWAAMIGYTMARAFDWWHYLFVFTLPLFIVHLVKVWHLSGKALDPQLPMLVISTFLFSLLTGIGFVVFLFQ